MNKLITVIIFGIFLSSFAIAQNRGDNGGNFNPDSLVEVTISGSAIVDTSAYHPCYFLDENSDGVADYKLNFGPFWYSPDSSEALRPLDGDEVTIFGGMHESLDSLNVIVVYEINGEFWRDPYEPFWNNFSHHRRFGRRLPNGFRGFAFGWLRDSLSVVSLDGTAIVDTTFSMHQYFLDENADGYPDYCLNFGPYWYEPASGAVRPVDGESISVSGGLIDRDSLDAVVVYEINGMVWRDSSSFRRDLRGKWLDRRMSRQSRVNNPFDEGDNFTVNQNWHMGGGMMDDSLFGQMLELYPQNIPNARNQNTFSGYEIGLFDAHGDNLMWQDGRVGRKMRFNSSVQYQLHYSDIQLNMYNVNENSIEVKYWDDQSNNWETVIDATVDESTNTIAFSTNNMSSLLIITGDGITGVEAENANRPVEFSLNQNFPNPFNPATKISYSLASGAFVNLTVYNILGEKVAVLINKEMNAGSYQVNFDAGNLPSGIYLYELVAGNLRIVKKMNLLK